MGLVAKMSRCLLTALFLASVLGGCATEQQATSEPLVFSSPTRSVEELQVGFNQGIHPFSEIARAYFQQYPNAPAAKVVVNLTIASDGTVAECGLTSSDSAPPKLVEYVLAEVRQLKFGARAVPEFRYQNYPIRLLPSRPQPEPE